MPETRSVLKPGDRILYNQLEGIIAAPYYDGGQKPLWLVTLEDRSGYHVIAEDELELVPPPPVWWSKLDDVDD
jgi:hypothetical protein